MFAITPSLVDNRKSHAFEGAGADEDDDKCLIAVTTGRYNATEVHEEKAFGTLLTPEIINWVLKCLHEAVSLRVTTKKARRFNIVTIPNTKKRAGKIQVWDSEA